MKLKHIGIVANLMKDEALVYTQRIAKWLNDHNLAPYMPEEVAMHMKEHVIPVDHDMLYEACDCLLVVGGDGTILGEAEAASQRQIPIVGVNLGRLGFLADIETGEIEQALNKLIHGQYKIEERMMLRATIVDPSGEHYVFHALNDINVTRGSFSRIVEFEITVNEELSDIYRADGVIVASPTGSTAYNLSAGGPIIVPHANTYVVTPICPHTIYSKSVMLYDEDKVRIRILEETEEMALSIDGKLKMYIKPQQAVYVERSPYVTQLIKISDRKFFEILRQKIVERRI